MSQLQPVRGTHDLLFDDARKHRAIIDLFIKIARAYNFEEIETPIFEFASVFNKTLGEASDIVSKEMYTFQDRGGDNLSLRPEGTAGVVRAFLSNNLERQLPIKWFYQGPMFRYERPQKGRYRQFHQIGVEALGIEHPLIDAEVIAMAQQLFNGLGIADKIELHINSIGDADSRKAYRTALVEFYNKNLTSLSDESKKRLQINPLRILDSKDQKDILINKNAPSLLDYLNSQSQVKLNSVLSALKAAGIKHHVNPGLVRGLDYYSHCVFEFRTSHLGSQDAVLSGGRYDSLVEMMGGNPTAGVGFAAGIERLSLLIENIESKTRPVVLLPLIADAEPVAFRLSDSLRSQNITTDIIYSGNLSNRFKKADRLKASHAVIIGENEIKTKSFTLKDFSSGEQQTLDEASLIKTILKSLS